MILGLGTVNERHCYNVMESLTGWAQAQNQPYIYQILTCYHGYNMKKAPLLEFMADYYCGSFDT